jgi:signal peptidase I
VKQTFYILTLTLGLLSCNGKTEKQNDKNSTLNLTDTINRIQTAVGDSIFKIGDFLFEAKKNAKFEFVKKGDKSKIKTKGDTLYFDNDIILFGDINEIISPGIFKKFKFKSQFNDFKTDNIYKGKLAKPNFSTDPDAKHFITRIKDGCKYNGVNFAGHYTIVEWGCGCLCQEMAIVDRINGDIIFSQIPFDTADGHSGTDFRIDSRMLIINIEALSEFDDYESGYKRYDHWRKPAVYEIKDGRLKQVE